MALDGKELNKRQTQRRKQIKEARLLIVSELYLKGWSLQRIADEVTQRLQLPKKVSKGTIQKDKELLLQQWREDNGHNTGEWVQLEVERVNMLLTELFEAWERSKTDYERVRASQVRSQLDEGKPAPATQQASPNEQPHAKGKNPMRITSMQTRDTVINYGNVGYISEIRKLLEYRAKLLGLYAPDRKELTGANGQPLQQTTNNIQLEDLTEDELTTLYNIAAKRDNKG